MQDVNSKMPGEFVKWEELDISNDFMFGKVILLMRDQENIEKGMAQGMEKGLAQGMEQGKV